MHVILLQDVAVFLGLDRPRETKIGESMGKGHLLHQCVEFLSSRITTAPGPSRLTDIVAFQPGLHAEEGTICSHRASCDWKSARG